MGRKSVNAYVVATKAGRFRWGLLACNPHVKQRDKKNRQETLPARHYGNIGSFVYSVRVKWTYSKEIYAKVIQSRVDTFNAKFIWC